MLLTCTLLHIYPLLFIMYGYVKLTIKCKDLVKPSQSRQVAVVKLTSIPIKQRLLQRARLTAEAFVSRPSRMEAIGTLYATV